MHDRLKAHFGDDIDALLAGHNHRALPRPVHSPDFGFVEWVFSHAQLFSKLEEAWILQHPEEFAQVFAAGLLSATADYVQQYAADAHYLVPGLD
jgi:hypothetical protein